MSNEIEIIKEKTLEKVEVKKPEEKTKKSQESMLDLSNYNALIIKVKKPRAKIKQQRKKRQESLSRFNWSNFDSIIEEVIPPILIGIAATYLVFMIREYLNN